MVTDIHDDVKCVMVTDIHADVKCVMVTDIHDVFFTDIQVKKICSL